MIRTATFVTAALALVACNTEPTQGDAAEELVAEQVAPPGAGGLTLTVDGVMENRNQMTFTVEGAQPGERVYLVFGTDTIASTGGTPLCPGPLGGLCFDVDSPQILGIPQNPLTADALGTATITLNAPPPRVLPDGFVAYFQAATLGGTAATSNVIGKFNPRDTGGIFAVDLIEGGDVDPIAGTFSGNRLEVWYSAAYLQGGGQFPGNGLDLCIIDFPVTAPSATVTAPPCPFCDFSFTSDYGVPTDGSVAGDCDFFGLDVSTIAPFQSSFGYSSAYAVPGYGTYPVAAYYYQTGGYWTWLTTGTYYGNGYFAFELNQIGFYYYP